MHGHVSCLHVSCLHVSCVGDSLRDEAIPLEATGARHLRDCRDRVEGSMSARSGARATRSLISRDRQDRNERAA